MLSVVLWTTRQRQVQPAPPDRLTSPDLWSPWVRKTVPHCAADPTRARRRPDTRSVETRDPASSRRPSMTADTEASLPNLTDMFGPSSRALEAPTERRAR